MKGMVKHNVHASVKDEKLVALRREQMIKGAVQLFKQKGFPRTTTREIAKAAGFSIGTLYEYIRTKDDVLYLVCDSIYEHVKERLEEVVCTEKGSIESLKIAITNYFKVMDELQEEVLIMYQEVRFLPKESLPYVLEKEFQMVGMFENILEQCTENGTFTLNKKRYSFLHITFSYKDKCGDLDVGPCKKCIRLKNIQKCKLGMYCKERICFRNKE